MITQAVLDMLARYDTPTICNVIELFEVRPDNVGYMDRRIHAAFTDLPPVVGFASTATCRTAVAPMSGGTYSKLSDHIARFDDLPGRPIVVLQDVDSPSAAATFGEIMCTTYRAFGATGLVTNGPGRDLDQVRALNFPVFIDGTCASHGYFHLLDLHQAVHIGGVAVYPGSLLHADRNGVTTIPHEIAPDVADACAEFVAAEQVMLDVMRAPDVNMARLREVIAEKDRLVGALRGRIASKHAQTSG